MISRLAFALLALSTSAFAAPQYVQRGSSGHLPGVTLPSASGGYQMGADNCLAPHTNAGTGDVFGLSFTTGTTGTTGQNEVNCYAFGGSGIDADVWFDWTASQSGNARVASCGATSVDTKIAVWPDHAPASCPPDGTSLACNEDLCGLQSSVTWPVVAGATYTIQVGTFPGASGGSGMLDISQSSPPPCGQFDDASSENAYGLLSGGEIGWLQRFACLSEVDEVHTAYGTALFPGSVTNGSGARIAVWDDLDGDGDPTTGTLLKTSLSTTIVNGDTDVLNVIPLGGCIATVGDLWVGATANHSGGEFPAPMDQDNPTLEAWVVGSTLGPGTLNLVNLGANGMPPERMEALGSPTAWLLRAVDASCNVKELCTLGITAIDGARENQVGSFAPLADPHEPGRLFIDTIAGGNLLEAPDEQYVELTVALGPPGIDPAPFEVRWEVRDPDDPATHPDVDSNDAGTPTGGDNTDALPTESGASRDFFAMAAHPIGDIASSGSDPFDPDRVIGRATTQLDANGHSSVRFHYGDEGGDNFRLRAVCVRIDSGAEEAQDESGLLTVWRARSVRVDAMAKVVDDLQLIPVGGQGANPTTPCIDGGFNGYADSYLVGDDTYGGLDGSQVLVGPNLICDTPVHNGGLSYFPDADLTGVIANLRGSFANQNGDHACYIDPIVFLGTSSAFYRGTLEPALGMNTGTGEHTYVQNHTDEHTGPGDDQHPRNTFHLIGMRAFHDAYEGRTANLRSHARVDPHAYVDVLRHYELYAQSGLTLDELRHSAAHLLAHQVVPEADDDLHGPHSAAPFHTCCGNEAAGQGTLWCPRHARRIRDNVTRAWAPHDDAIADPRESERDSD